MPRCRDRSCAEAAAALCSLQLKNKMRRRPGGCRPTALICRSIRTPVVDRFRFPISVSVPRPGSASWMQMKSRLLRGQVGSAVGVFRLLEHRRVVNRLLQPRHVVAINLIRRQLSLFPYLLLTTYITTSLNSQSYYMRCVLSSVSFVVCIVSSRFSARQENNGLILVVYISTREIITVRRRYRLLDERTILDFYF